MGAPKGNQFAKDNKGGGRKGYEFEAKQLKRMSKILNGMLTLGEKIQSGKANKEHLKRFEILLKLNLKIMDKLHANRQRIEGTGEKGELPFIINIIKEDGKTKGEDS